MIFSAIRYQARRRAIARSYGRRWRVADHSELPEFLRLINLSLSFDVDEPGIFECREKPRRREILLLMESGRTYRAKLRKWPDPWRPIRVADVETFEMRRPG